MSTHEAPHKRAHRMLKESGYHSDEAQDRALVDAMVKPTALKRKRGGGIEGKEPADRPDKRARGGATKAPKLGGVHVNVMHSDPAAEAMAKQQGVQQGLKVGAQLGAKQAMAGGGHPPMGAPPMAGPGMAPPGAGGPPGAMAPRPPMPPTAGGAMPQMAAKGGRIREEEKIKVKAHERRKGGALCE